MKDLTVEIHGTGTWNRGGELMAIAASERVRSLLPGARVVVPLSFGSGADRRKYRLLGTWEEGPLRRRRAYLRRLALASGPSLVRRWAEVVRPSEIDVVLDASGFSFSDQWGPNLAAQLLQRMERPSRRHQKLILLPQALGPFEHPEVAERSRRLFARASLVCARDTTSFAAAERLGGARRLILSPDFTIGVKAMEVPPEIRVPDRFVAIVPNYRMIDKTGDPEKYLAFLGTCIDTLRTLGMNPVFVLHDGGEDRKVAERVNAARGLPMIGHPDPRVVKGVLGRADLVIASRFHALVSSLSQGVPCVGAGWSHKYPELFAQFGVPECLMADLGDAEGIATTLTRLAGPEVRADMRARLVAASAELRAANDRMWAEVADTIRSG